MNARILAQAGIVGEVNQPPGVSAYTVGGISQFVGNIVKLLIVFAGLYAVFNFILAGYAFLSAGDDPKKIEGAWAKIWQTILGMTIAAGAFVLASVFGKILFGDANALLQIRVFKPS